MANHPPATPFMDGYTRNPAVTGELIAHLAAALYAFPAQRLGQLLVNLARQDDLFNVYDEEILARLKGML